MQTEKTPLHARSQSVRTVGHIAQIGDHRVLPGQNITSLPPLTVDTEAISIFPEKIPVSALAIHLLDGGGPFDVVLGDNPVSFKRPALDKQQADLAQVMHGQFHPGCTVKVSVWTPGIFSVCDVQRAQNVSVDECPRILLHSFGQRDTDQISGNIAVMEPDAVR